MKGLHVLATVASQHRLSDIATATGLSPSTVHRILAELVDDGWVEQAPDRSYRPGLRVHGLVSLLHDDDEIVRLALPHLRALRDRTGFTVHMARHGPESLVYIAKIDGLGSYQMRSRVGDTIPLWSTSIGKAVLASMDQELAHEMVVHAHLERRTPSTIMSRRALLQQLDVIRERGWSYDDGENELHTRCVGVSVRDAAARVIGGISLSGLDHEMTSRTAARLAPLVVETRQRVERRLLRPNVSI